jgi:predicted permease
MGRKKTQKDRWAQDNRLAANPAAYAATIGIVLAVVGLFVLFYFV